ncbi:MAG: dockerin type I domain-containing protein, partial [Chloroflexi bacterium]|nr:dockerin type I domain-containing protein [Chloroflexota bacterium]
GAVIGSLFLIVSLVVGASLVSQKQDIRKKAAASTSLAISPGSQNVYADQNFSLSVMMDTGSNAIIGFDINLNFDYSSIEITSVTKGSAIANFAQVRNIKDNTTGKIVYSAYTPEIPPVPVSGSGLEVIKIDGKVKAGVAPGSKTIDFEATKIRALGEDQNVLQIKTPGMIVVIPAVVAPVVTLGADPSTIIAGGNSTITWSTVGANPTCTKSDGWAGTAAASGSQVVTSATTKIYSLTCTNSAGSDTKSVAITATPKDGDVNNDGFVNSLDILRIVENYGTTGNPGWIPADIYRDGTIDIFDIGKVIDNYGK